MKIECIDETMAEVSAGSIKSRVSIQLVEHVKKGDFVLVHAGVAIEKINRQRAQEILALLSELGQKVDEGS